MIPKVKSVESLLLKNDTSDHFLVHFRKVVFHKGSPYLLLQHDDHHIVMEVKSCRSTSKLIGLHQSDYEGLRVYFQDIRIHPSDWEDEYKVVGIEFNRVENNKRMNTELRISDGKPLDILPYVVQTGAEYVFFTE